MKEKALETVFTWYYSGVREIHSDRLPFFAPTHASFSVNEWALILSSDQTFPFFFCFYL